VPFADEGASAAPAAGDVEEESLFTGKRVFLIDADVDTRRTTAALLSSWGCDVVSASSARAALRLAETDEPPAILLQEDPLDGVVGEELRAALASRWGETPPTVLIATAPSAADIERAHAAGLRYLVKPLAPARLRAVMSRLLMLAGQPG